MRFISFSESVSSGRAAERLGQGALARTALQLPDPHSLGVERAASCFFIEAISFLMVVRVRFEARASRRLGALGMERHLLLRRGPVR